MSLNETPSGERVQIGLFGKRNVGKSSLFNGIANQELAVVSDQLGTTTDPVRKAMEILPIGPVVLWDTPGMDDQGMLGDKRVEKTKQALDRVDIAILVVDVLEGMQSIDLKWLELVKERNLPYIIVYNKADLSFNENVQEQINQCENAVVVSAKKAEDMHLLRETISRLNVGVNRDGKLLADIVQPNQWVLLVIPIDESAPKGRLILPQQLVMRELLDMGAIAIAVKDTELKTTLSRLEHKPDLVITDSQVFEFVSQNVSEDIKLTSFSILMARKKNFLEIAVNGVREISKLKDGDCILIAEGCTHHRQCKDIGTVKLPAWLEAFTENGVDMLAIAQREIPLDEALPWDTVDIGVTKEYFISEYKKAQECKTTHDCRLGCTGCGLMEVCARIKKEKKQ